MGFSQSRACTFPQLERIGAILLEGWAVYQMTLKVEGIVGGGLNVEEALCGSW